MRKARDCIQNTYKGKRVSIGWMIVDGNTMKAINLGDIPYYIDKNNGQKNKVLNTFSMTLSDILANGVIILLILIITVIIDEKKKNLSKSSKQKRLPSY